MKNRSRCWAAVLLALLLGGGSAMARMHSAWKSKSIPTVQATLFVGSENHVSNIEFWQTNYGELFLDVAVANGKAGTWWPRGYGFSYVFGGGFWFGCVKDVNGKPVRHVLVGYNPYNGGSWFLPGSVDAAQAFYDSTLNATGKGRFPGNADADYDNKYTIYYSTDYNTVTGQPLNSSKQLPPWPIWDTDSDPTHIVGQNHYFGNYVDDVSKRDTSVYPIRYITQYTTHIDTSVTPPDTVVVDSTLVRKGGPAFVSEEDMFTVCNDLDTALFAQASGGRAYPLHVQVQRTIYSWGSQVNKDYIFIAYKIINQSNNTLDSCWLAPVMDADIGLAANDECGYYNKDTTLNLAIQWSNKEQNVPLSNQQYAYPGVLGVDFLESPSVYQKSDTINGNPIPDSLVGTIKPGVHPNAEQLGMKTFDRWDISQDKLDDDARYTFMTGGNRDTAPNPPQYSDKRFLFATGPFKLLSGQSAEVVTGVMVARDSADGDNNLQSSINDCVALCRRAQTVYDGNFQVPFPPDEPTIRKAVPLSNGVFLQWDSASEFSYDPISGGLDFMGYRLYRGRRDLVGINGTNLYDLHLNPWGFKMIKQWSLRDLDDATFSMIEDSLPVDQKPEAVRQYFYRNFIYKYMDSLTNHHTYYDFGDDDHNGVVEDNEKLLNDVDYYYWLAAFDEGDTSKGIASQQTIGKVGQSKVRVHPVSSYAGTNSTYQILPSQGLLGGISDFRWDVQNQEIIDELLAGDTLTVTFNHNLNYYIPYLQVYGLNMRVQDPRASLDITYPYWKTGSNFPIIYAAAPPNPNGQYYTLQIPWSDTTTLKQLYISPTGVAGDSTTVMQQSGLLESNDTVFTPNQYLLNAVGHLMNYRFLQAAREKSLFDTLWEPASWYFLPYDLDTLSVDSGTFHTHSDISRAFGVMHGNSDVSIGFDPKISFDSAADAGQYDYLVQFIDTIKYEQDTLLNGTYIVNVPYLTMKITGEQIYHVITAANTDSTVNISYDLTPVNNVNDLQAGQWASDAVVWRFTPSLPGTSDNFSSRRQQYVGAMPNGYADRYYLTATLDTTTFAMVNRLHVGGYTIIFDSAYKGYTRLSHDTLSGINPHPATQDFKSGDVVRISYKGGILGLPTPGASFQTVFTQSVPPDSSNVTSDELSKVNVWPNPYIIGNSVDPNAPGLQKPEFGDRLVFNHLPPRCTIKIFNIVGDLIRTINHTSGSEEYWDLLSGGGQRVGSQMLIAQVETPYGVKQDVKIAVIVSGR